jgi:2',3'-cyclic-nucleotide 2'-phosphodiesterase (5'-nucleotidase family)
LSCIRTIEDKTTQLEAKKRSSGGRAPGNVDKVSTPEGWQPSPCQPDEARLTVIQITDTYTLENLASVKTLLADVRAKSTGSKVISMMTGDFLAPYLLSSVDRGQGMMNALAKIPIDFISWGNHEVRKVMEFVA